LAGISYIKALGRLFYPVCCAACGQALVDREQHICTLCTLTLPVTNYHVQRHGPLQNLFQLRMRVDFISSYLLYDQGLSTQRILHAIKYKGDKLLAAYLGERYGNDLGPALEHKVDCIIPVPLHKRKLRERGYNQSEYWAQGLAKSLAAPVNTQSLVRQQYTTTQTKKSRMDRIKNVEQAFAIKQSETLKGQRVLLVDDVITTGATLEACGVALWKAGIRSLAIVTIAFAEK
jgi:ComF family protein